MNIFIALLCASLANIILAIMAINFGKTSMTTDSYLLLFILFFIIFFDCYKKSDD